MKTVVIKIFILVWIYSFTGTLWSKPQNIILTGSQGTGSHIFATELSRLWTASRKNRKMEIISRTEISPENRLTQLTNNRVPLAIIDAKTAHEKLSNHPGLRVLTVLWENWLYILGTVPGQFLSLESTQTLLVHDNSLYFAQVWKKLAPQTKLNWFNSSSIPDFKDGFSEEVLAVTGPVPLKEINNWLEQFAGIRLLALDRRLIRSLNFQYPWLRPKKLLANTFSYQSEAKAGVAWNPVLVVRGDFPKDLATTLLKMIFAQKEALNPHILFQNLLRTDNITFRESYPYHSASKTMFRFK